MERKLTIFSPEKIEIFSKLKQSIPFPVWKNLILVSCFQIFLILHSAFLAGGVIVARDWMGVILSDCDNDSDSDSDN